MTILLLFVAGVAMLALPTGLAMGGIDVGLGASAVSWTLGGASVAFATGLAFFQKLYVKTKASEAFVRTGSGGVKVIQDGGAIVIPLFHELIPVNLQTLKLQVSRDSEDALITQDKLRADIHAEFFVRVQPERGSILQASRSLGERMSDASAVRALVEDKLVSALRTAAASKTLEQLNSERDEFLAEVMKLVADDLLSNGLILETVTISRLDQTDEKYLKNENIFDAQGRRKIAEITQTNLTERNRLVREGERARKAEDVQTQKRVLELDREEQEASALQSMEVAKIRADAERQAREKLIEAQRKVELAEIGKVEALQVAERVQQKTVEVAEREKQERIAEAERRRAAAEQALAEAEAERELARQRVETVKVTESAAREKQKAVIDAEAMAETSYVSEQRKADAEAYTLQKQAEAKKLAADAAAEAVRKQAEAEADAERMRAAGERAKAMVPVEVQSKQVEVDRERIETVVKPELEAREQHGKVAQDFEIAKLRVAAEKAVRIAMAEASSKLFEKMEAHLYGSPEEVTKILDSVVRGQSVAKTISGFLDSADDQTKGALGALGAGMKQIASNVLEKSAEDRVTAEAEVDETPEAA